MPDAMSLDCVAHFFTIVYNVLFSSSFHFLTFSYVSLVLFSFSFVFNGLASDLRMRSDRYYV